MGSGAEFRETLIDGGIPEGVMDLTLGILENLNKYELIYKWSQDRKPRV